MALSVRLGGCAAEPPLFLSILSLSLSFLFSFSFSLPAIATDRYRSLAIADFRWQARHFRPEGSFPAAPCAKVPLIQENNPSALSVRLGGCAAEPPLFLSILSLSLSFLFSFSFSLPAIATDRYRSLAIADFRWQARHFRPEGSFPAAPCAKVPLIQENNPSALSVRLGGCAAEPEGDFFLSIL